MQHEIKTLLAVLGLVAAIAAGMYGCSGCALVAPEGEAGFWSAPADWPGVHP